MDNVNREAYEFVCSNTTKIHCRGLVAVVIVDICSVLVKNDKRIRFKRMSNCAACNQFNAAEPGQNVCLSLLSHDTNSELKLQPGDVGRHFFFVCHNLSNLGKSFNGTYIRCRWVCATATKLTKALNVNGFKRQSAILSSE